MKIIHTQSDSTSHYENSISLSPEITSRNEEMFTIQISVPYSGSMLEAEEIIQGRLNDAGVLATQEVLGRFDTDGTNIQHGATTFFSKGKEPKTYQTPYGARCQLLWPVRVNYLGLFSDAGFLG
ncbi:MAG: hypothetical protein ABW115_09210 [Candidatus Thiodiazotropha sp. 6PLUC6]